MAVRKIMFRWFCSFCLVRTSTIPSPTPLFFLNQEKTLSLRHFFLYVPFTDVAKRAVIINRVQRRVRN